MARLPYVIPYDPAFLGGGFQVPLPTPRCRGNLYQAGAQIDYIHASLVLHEDRRMALVAAHNIDVSRRRSVPRVGWALDPRIPSGTQTGPSAYANNVWDRGHLVRRAAVAWGDTQARAQDASDATFYYPNAAPQHQDFNREEWVALEDWVLQEAAGVSPLVCVFTGPIYTTADVVDSGVRIPSAFWKIVVLRDPTAAGDDLAALGFVMKQNELWTDWNGGEMEDFETFQVGIAEIGGYAGLDFGQLAQLDEFEWRQARFRNRRRMAPIRIRGPKDIEFHGDNRRARGIRALRVASSDGPLPGPVPAVPAADAHCASCGDRGRGARNGKGAAGDATAATDATAVGQRVESLKRQVDALREVVDSLIEDDSDCTPEEREANRGRAVETFARIVGGNIVATGEFPECACIGDDGDYFCSGVLVHPRVVLTAAHCAPSIDRVYLGGRSLTLIGVVGEVVNVERVHVHPDYDLDLVPAHDIAVLVLDEAAGVDPVDIAATDGVDGEDDVTLVGFGYEHPTEDVGFGTKRRASVPLTPVQGINVADLAALEELHGFDGEFEIHAGRKELGVDSCNGDSGGPAYIGNGDDGFTVAAITSRASFSAELRCGDGGIYTRIAPYLAWIEEVTGGLVAAGDDADLPPPPTTAACMYISAVMPNPAGPDKGHEWVEISNGGPHAGSLDGYELSDKQGGVEDLSGALAVGATRRITLPANSKVKLANAGDEVVLSDENGEVHHVSYQKVGSGQIVQFDNPCPPTDSGCGGDGDDDAYLPNADPC